MPSRSRHHSPRYIAGLAAVAGAILVIGFQLKPRETQSEAPRPPSQIETQRLARLAQRQALDAMTDHFSLVVADLTYRVLQIGAGTGSGILWETDLVVTAGRGTPSPESTVVLTPNKHLLTATRVIAGPQLPLSAYELPGGSPYLSSRITEAGPLEPAEWILAVWHQEGDLAFSPGHFLETRSTTCGEGGAGREGGEVPIEEVLTGLPLSGEMAGGGLFDLDGGLVAVILPCGKRLAALRPASVSRFLAMGRTLEAQLLAQYGIRTVAVPENARDHLGVEEGALVIELWSGHRADASGLRPGDVIVGLGEQPVASPRDLQPLLLPPELRPGLVRARRGRRTLDVDLTAGLAPEADEGDDDRGVRLAPPPAGVLVGAVAPGSPGDTAGLRSGDRIIRVDGREPRDANELRRSLARSRAIFVELERGPRRLGMLLEP